AATAGTAAYLAEQGLVVRTVHKVQEGHPHVVDHLINGEIQVVVNTPLGQASHEDDAEIRRTALKYDIPCITTLSGAMAMAEGIAALPRDGLAVPSRPGRGRGYERHGAWPGGGGGQRKKTRGRAAARPGSKKTFRGGGRPPPQRTTAPRPSGRGATPLSRGCASPAGSSPPWAPSS